MPILLDMDEVLADFATAAARIHDYTREQLEAVWPAGSWSIVEPMGLTAEEFWEPIHAVGEAFWLGLQPTPWARQMVALVQQYAGDNWYVVSSPSRSPSCYSGKARWLQWFLRSGFGRLVLTNHKHLLARPDAILIDDREETMDRFIKAGGRGIIFPCRHNRLHRITNRLTYVETQLQEQTNALSVS